MNYDTTSILGWTHYREERQWVIEKSERRICFGNPGYIDEWTYQSFHNTEEEAKKELDRLLSFCDPLSRRNYRIIDTKVNSYNVK